MQSQQIRRTLFIVAAGAVIGCGSEPIAPNEFIPITSLSGDATLATEILTPVGTGPYPAIVVVHGAGTALRQDLEAESRYHIALGFASARYDKRGVGQSTGEFTPVTPENSEAVFGVLADDVLAIVQYLKTRPEIDANRIGLLGASQAGWIMPLAASRSSDVAFMAGVSGAASTVGLADFYASIASGKTEQEIADELANFTGTHGFDPVPSLESLTIPGLWVYGGQDLRNPTVNDMEILERITTDLNKDFTICLFPRANHVMANVVDGDPIPVRQSCVTPWLQERLN